jgi:hypothetical protein
MNFEAEYINLPKKEIESKSSEQEKIQRAEYFVDRIISDVQKDPVALEVETQHLEMHIQGLLDMLTKSQSPDALEIRESAERVIFKLFKNAEYEDLTQLDSPPAYRKYKDQYSGSMKKIYSFLAVQTMASSGNITKDYDHLPYFTRNSTIGSAVITALEKRDKGEVTKDQLQAADELLKKILEEYGLPLKDTLEAWKSSGYSEGEKDEVTLGAIQNIEAMRYLERTKPGSVSALRNQFGIRHFGRYPENLLLEQCQEIDNSSKPYGVMFSAVDDHNGAFRTDWGDTKFLWDSLEGKYLLRAFEFDRKFSLGRRLVESDNKYGKDNKISFSVFRGHAEKNRVIFGKHKENVWNFLSRTLFKKSIPTSITSEDLEGEGFKRAKKFFIESPHFIFEACSAGEEGGIVQKVSKTYEGEALGQDYAGSNLPIKPVFNNEGVIDRFETLGEWEELAGRYQNGERIKPSRISEAA